MEKRKPHYPLARLRALILDGKYHITRSALKCAASDFGLVESAQIAECVLGVKNSDFYKSMTTIHDATLWQDVYRPKIGGIPAYVKVQIVDSATVVISFKFLEDD